MYYELAAQIGKALKIVEDAAWAKKRKAPRRALPGLTLYHFQISPFSYRVRKAIVRLELDIRMKDVLNDQKAWEELVRLGGEDQVPCLRIQKDGPSGKEDTWMYESKDIVQYLKNAAK